MEILLAAALAVCAEDPSKCVVEEIGSFSHINVCGLSPEERGRPIQFAANLPNGKYIISLEPSCKNI